MQTMILGLSGACILNVNSEECVKCALNINISGSPSGSVKGSGQQPRTPEAEEEEPISPEWELVCEQLKGKAKGQCYTIPGTPFTFYSMQISVVLQGVAFAQNTVSVAPPGIGQCGCLVLGSILFKDSQ